MAIRRSAAAALAVLSASLCQAASASAEIVRFTATLSGQNEVPPIVTPSRGSADITLDTVTRRVTWEIRVQGLTSAVRSAHFHGVATPAQNAPVTLALAGRDAKPPFKGSQVLTPEQMQGLLAGRWYINVHTAKFPPGEVRGQIVRR